jgi:hypothetical protein
LALNSPENRLRVLMMDRPLHRRIHLSWLSQEVGPPLTFSLVAGVIFAVVALFHLVRIVGEWTIIIGDWSVPKSVSWVALIVAGGLALVGLRLSQRE